MIRRIALSLALALLIPLGLALGLIASQWPSAQAAPPAGGLDFSGTLAAGVGAPTAVEAVPMRDGFPLQVRRYGPEGAARPLLILLHGSGWHGQQFEALARDLAPEARILVPDLRGHGAQPGRRGDIDYIGQFEDDLADLIRAEARPGQRVILGGHSSGGGLVVRFAGGPQGGLIDGALLLAPFLKHNAPTTRPNSGGWARPLTRRIVGLSMLNGVGIGALNHLTAIQFNMPAAVLEGPLGATATTAYSYRLNRSYAPRGDYLADVAALPPFLLIAGAEDEAFDAALYRPTMESVTGRGTYLVVPGEGHLSILQAAATRRAIRDLLHDQ